MPHKKERAAPAPTGDGSENDQPGGTISPKNTTDTAKSQAGRRSRRKGALIEREIVNLHRALGIHAERVPLSGAAHYKGKNHDIDILPDGHDGPPLCCEVKARGNGEGFATLGRS